MFYSMVIICTLLEPVNLISFKIRIEESVFFVSFSEMLMMLSTDATVTTTTATSSGSSSRAVVVEVSGEEVVVPAAPHPGVSLKLTFVVLCYILTRQVLRTKAVT